MVLIPDKHGQEFDLAVLNAVNTFLGNQTIDGILKINNTFDGAIEIQEAGFRRWLIGKASAENGTDNSGSDFTIYRYDNNGAYLSAPFKIMRVSGETRIGLLRMYGEARYNTASLMGSDDGSFASKGYVDGKVMIAKATVDEQDVNNNQVLAVSNELNQSGWSFDDTAKSYTYTGSPVFIEITGHVSQRISDTTNGQRPAPGLKLQKNISGTRTDIAQAYTGYIRDISDHENSSNSIPSYVDASPGVNPEYRLYCEQETTNGSVVTSLMGHFVLKANN